MPVDARLDKHGEHSLEDDVHGRLAVDQFAHMHEHLPVRAHRQLEPHSVAERREERRERGMITRLVERRSPRVILLRALLGDDRTNVYAPKLVQALAQPLPHLLVRPPLHMWWCRRAQLEKLDAPRVCRHVRDDLHAQRAARLRRSAKGPVQGSSPAMRRRQVAEHSAVWLPLVPLEYAVAAQAVAAVGDHRHLWRPEADRTH
eukprot:7390504-Prymnesium_polylepis.1